MGPIGEAILQQLRIPSTASEILGFDIGGTQSPPPGPMSVGPGSDWAAVARQMAMQKGYSPQDWQKLNYIIEHESNWDPNAVNKSSGAAGIAQRISGYGPGYERNNPMSQLQWLFNYIQSRYGGIDQAYAHKQSTGWY